jgi:23S rRNA (uracil1939-C5)-methyltransferase
LTTAHQPVENFAAWLPSVANQSGRPAMDTVVVDPPRTGMSREALDGVLSVKARQLVYVSCDVATLARDARRLVDAGYTIARTDAFDLFPNTPHVETVVVFST